MPRVEISSAASLPWYEAGTAAGGAGLPWRDAALVVSTGGPFWLPDPPPGSTPTRRGTEPLYWLPAADEYAMEHTLEVRDAETGEPIEVEALSLAYEDGSMCWTLSASGAGLFDSVAGLVPPIWDVVLDGMLWRFIIETGGRRRGEFGFGPTSVSGRSVTAFAAEPYAPATNWLNEGPATAAQLVDQAHADTGVAVEWLLDDWLVPDRVWSYTGTPGEVARRVADAAGADVRSDRAEPTLRIEPRYRHLPEVWHLQPPDVEIHGDAILGDDFARADRPPWDAVYVAGQQQGITAYVHRAGAVGDLEGPYTTDVLITEDVAARQRGMAILGSAGPQARVGLDLPVLTGPQRPGVLEPGQLCRVVERGAPPWWGVVRSVRVDVRLPEVTQTATLERHMIELESQDPDVWQVRTELATLEFLAAYAVDFPGVLGIGGAFEADLPPSLGLGTGPWSGTLSEGGFEVTLANPPTLDSDGYHGRRAINTSPYYDIINGGFRAEAFSGGRYAVEFYFKSSGGRRDSFVGVRGARGAVLLHQAGVTDPHGHAGLPVKSPGLIPGDVVGLVLTPLSAIVTVYLNGTRLFDHHVESWPLGTSGALGGAALVGRADPRAFPMGFRGK